MTMYRFSWREDIPNLSSQWPNIFRECDCVQKTPISLTKLSGASPPPGRARVNHFITCSGHVKCQHLMIICSWPLDVIRGCERPMPASLWRSPVWPPTRVKVRCEPGRANRKFELRNPSRSVSFIWLCDVWNMLKYAFQLQGLSNGMFWPVYSKTKCRKSQSFDYIASWNCAYLFTFKGNCSPLENMYF